MPGIVRKCLRDKTIRNVMMSHLSEDDKHCVLDVFIRYEQMLDREAMTKPIKNEEVHDE